MFCDEATQAPEERLVPASSRGHPWLTPTPRVESSSGVTRRIASPASPGVSSKTPRPGRQSPRWDSFRWSPRLDASKRNVRTQLVKEHPGFTATSAHPERRGRVGGALHGARPASARSLREGAGVIDRNPSEAAASDAPGARASTGLATDGGARDPLALLRTGTRVNGPGSPQSSERLRLTETPLAPGRLLLIDVRPEHARERPDFPAHPERSRAGAVGHEGHGR